ncbi:MAG TPA: FAD-binding oxidoreductase [Candidatus Paceibacterota bacterium]|nr:FAD-binding oxidoreductase [Candidatus Paceibacterota bacterium]
MKINRSPWIHQLDKTRAVEKLRADIETDIAIVGAGIAGIATAFFVLKHTDKKVAIIEKSRIAHGATGHNAGQIVSYFERPFTELCEEFGLDLAAEGQRSIELAWELFDEMYTEAGLRIPFSRFIGYDGLSTYDQVLGHLKNAVLRAKTGLPIQEMWLSDRTAFAANIPKEYAGFYKLVPQEDIQTALETEKRGFVAVTLHHKGVVNSALFSEHVAAYIKQKYRDRVIIYEETPILKVVLHDKDAVLDAGTHMVTADHVVLCTNGFENLTIQNKAGMAIDTKFHHLVNGVVGRMSGYLEKMNKPPMAASYYVPPEGGFANMDDPYFYITRREYEYEKGADHNLVCLGGPQHDIPDREEYLYEFDYPEEVQVEVDKFVRDLYAVEPNRKIEYQFTWHGLMGYTPNRVRLIGAEPKNQVLLYNLGCNGVGILPSIYGGKRIARILSGDKVEKSIFDPKEP